MFDGLQIDKGNPAQFITFEGIDGSGKTSQARLLHRALTDRGIPALLTREPGGTGLGQELRGILLNHKGELDKRTELLLFLADRAQHVAEVIRPALAAGTWVICDRYVDSTLAYQCYGRGLGWADVRSGAHLASGGLWPDQTFLLDLPVEQARARRQGQPDRMESAPDDFHQRIRAGYLALAEQEPGRIKVLDAMAPVDRLAGQVLEAVDLKL